MCDATVLKFVRLMKPLYPGVAALASRSPSSNRPNAPLFPGFIAPRLYRSRQVRAYCFIRASFLFTTLTSIAHTSRLALA
jgi:hypothetical protein